MKALLDKIIIRPFPPKEETAGGLFIPENARQRPNKATIISAGRKSYLKEGNTVFHIQGAGEMFHVKQETFYVIEERDVLAYIEN